MFTRSDEPIEHSEAVPMFPTLVWKTYLKRHVYGPMNERIMDAFGDLRQSLGALPRSKTWQTDQNLHELEAFSGLMSYVSSTAKGILDFTKIAYNDFLITGCWANIAAEGGSHIAHTHPNNYLSDVYYVQTQKGADRIVFDDPRVQRSLLSPPVKELNEMNAPKVIMAVEEGLLLMFPSWLVHSVEPNTSGQERVSVSFNIMFSAFGETMSRPKWQPSMRTGVHADRGRTKSTV